jgi:hypothetical protein
LIIVPNGTGPARTARATVRASREGWSGVILGLPRRPGPFWREWRLFVETKNTVPMWLAVAITVVISLPFGLWLDAWNIPLWAAFIVWAEYFVLGGKPEALKTLVPAYLLGVVGAAFVLIIMVAFLKAMPDLKLVKPGDLPIAIALFIGFCILIYAMKFVPVVNGAGTLCFFNGISMGLATFFIGALYATYGGINISGDLGYYLSPVITCIPAALAGLLGAFLGWFNVTILFPRQVSSAPQVAPMGRGA